ncbi:MAG: kynureninase [Ardenticatenaceae bacterium]|nr:kynureninase [Ardenticatenaceae bacterium]MCB8946651.1 kynureninase [Ardenticatenaceae bacterium]
MPITDLAYAQQLDAQDPLAHFRDQFVIDDPDLIYLDGNSLGRLLKRSRDVAQDLVDRQWGKQLIRGWNEGWIDLQSQIGGKIGQLIGADADEVIVADSTSINLFKLALAAVNFNNGRSKIITDDLNFPSDLYILQGVARLAKRPLQLQIIPSDDIHGPVEALAAAIDDDTALVALSHTVFKSSYTYDMAKITQLAHNAGALMLWDMSHSVGSVPADLHAANAPLAVGCTYKYLNGGPGSPAFLYVQRNWQRKLGNPITGWMGHESMFDFALDYERDAGLRHFLTGTPPVLSTALIEPGVDLLLEAGMDRLRDKSVQQTSYLLDLWREWLAPLGFRLNSPAEAAQRGSHISLGHDDSWRISQALINEMRVIPDFRKPDNIRLGIAPIYTRYTDIYEAMHRLRQVMLEKLYERYSSMENTFT